jgi:hypothetical protein
MTPYRARRRCRFNQISCYMSAAYLMRTLITEEARNVFELGLPPGPAMALPGLSRSTDDLFYSDPFLRRG